MAIPTPQKTVLLLIDIQAGFAQNPYWGTTRSNPSFEPNASLLLTTYRKTLLPSPNHKIIHVHHSSIHPTSPLHPSSPGMQPAAYALPLPSEEPIYYKSVNSAFIGTPLSALLETHFGATGGRLYVAGLTTDHCVSTSIRMAANLYAADGRDEQGKVIEGRKGEVVLIEDATAAWAKGDWDAETVHKVHVASLNGEFARVAKTGDVIGEWEALKGVT
ncbi:isochorismatase hydrolase [Mollisia scopiformis]|uniref:Isochorismatase hydrolase n=1 Tax=Mollisia scopiformis TaxID=149040 RepID=A0A194XSD3_MOLSC|nr:isochorismatase hydrolase [Mollisia scopiformis]KUJ22949.1 isochorismatase hydrolase [Mollisia scopiformis]